MATPMVIAILTAVRDEVRGMRDDFRECREEWRRYKLEEEEKWEAERKEERVPAFGKVEKSTPYSESFSDADGRRIGRKEGEKMSVRDKAEDWRAEQAIKEQEAERKGAIEKSYKGPEERMELRRRLRGVMAKTSGAQVAGRRPGATESARTVVRPEGAEITLDEVQQKKRELCRKQTCGMDEDLNWIERATSFRLREKAEEEWRKEKEARLSRKEVGVDVEEW